MIESVRAHLRLPYRLSAGSVNTRFFEGIRNGEVYGTRCVACGSVYVPPRGFCSQCWEPCDGWVRVADSGTVAGFVVVNVPFYGQEVEIPYVLAQIVLDGADVAFLHLVITPDDMKTGMRVKAVWREQRTGFLSEDIDHFEPETPT